MGRTTVTLCVLVRVRKHRAPQISHVIPFFQLCTNSQKSQNFNDPTSNVETTGRELRATFLRNHPRPAPNGALRPDTSVIDRYSVVSQKAPSAKRCIKTHRRDRSSGRASTVRKHRAPKGALRPVGRIAPGRWKAGQKAPSAREFRMQFP